MRRTPPALIASILAVAVGACGSSTGVGSRPRTVRAASSHPTEPAPASLAPAAAETKADHDKDNDFSSYDDTNHNELLDYGRAASPAETGAVTALIRRYYAAAHAEDGASACSMIVSSLARAVPEDYGSPPGPTYMRGTTCPAVLTLLFKHFRPQIDAELPLLRVARVRAGPSSALVALRFGAMPERRLYVTREGGVWKLEALLDSAMP